MEFSHVFILDGGWAMVANEEQRRLFYVAMTRAKETLCLLQRSDFKNPYLKNLQGDFVLRRNSDLETQNLPQFANNQYKILGLKDFDLSYAGSFAAKDPVHQVLATLTVGEKITMKMHNGKIVLKKDNNVLAMLSKTAQAVWQKQLENIVSATVIAMITRYISDNEEEFKARCKVEQWEVPMIEVVLNKKEINSLQAAIQEL